jgi:hypothetical protein
MARLLNQVKQCVKDEFIMLVSPLFDSSERKCIDLLKNVSRFPIGRSTALSPAWKCILNPGLGVEPRTLHDRIFRVALFAILEGEISFPVPPSEIRTVEPYLDRNVILGLRPETIARAGAWKPAPYIFCFRAHY